MVYVAPDGTGSECTSTAPCALLQAQDKVRALTEDLDQDIRVVLSDGVYRLSEPLLLQNQDGGNDQFQVSYEADSGAVPVISGGVKITNWITHDSSLNIWKAPVDNSLDTRQLYVNGVRAQRARSAGGLPGAEMITENDPKNPYRDNQNQVAVGYFTTAGEMVDWKNPQDLEFVYRKKWTNPRAPVATITPWGSMAKIEMKNPAYFWVKNKASSSPEAGPWYLENAYELLDEPGEFYLDRSAHTLYYRPRPGEDLSVAEVVAPVLETLIRVEGKALHDRVENVTFRGLTFQHTTWLQPNTKGFPDAQNGVQRERFLMDGSPTVNGQKAYDDYPKYYDFLDSNGAVVVKYAHNIRFDGNEFSKLGYLGLLLRDGVQQSAINGNRFVDISHTAVQVGDDYDRGDPQDFYPSDTNLLQKDHRITNNYISQAAREYRSATGIGAAYPVNLLIEHNEISELPYSGIHLGWGWSYIGGIRSDETDGLSTEGPPPTKDVLIQKNHIHHTMRELYDGGHIYVLGTTSGGNIIRENFLEQQYNPYAALYTDEGSNGYQVSNNVIDQTPYWLWIWTSSIRNIMVDSTYTNQPEFRNDGTDCTIGHTVAYEKNDYPFLAKRIIEHAGLLQRYYYLIKGISSE